MLRIEVVQDAVFFRAIEIHAPHGHGDDFGA